MDVHLTKLVVALESLGYQCQYLDGALVATNGANRLSYSEDSRGNAVGTFPASVTEALRSVSDRKVKRRFNGKTLEEMGYVNFSPSKDKATGTDDVTSKKLGVDSGDQTVTDETPQKGPKKPQKSSELPNEYTGGSDNNDPHGLPDTGGDAEYTKVGPHGAAKTGKPGPNMGKPEKTQGMKVGHSLQQPESPDADKGNYTGSKVGFIGNSGSALTAGATSKGSSPAPLPKDQSAQSLPKIPSPGKGKMTVASKSLESLIASADNRISEEAPGRSLFVMTRRNPGESWAMSGTFGLDDAGRKSSQDLISEFSSANPGGSALVVSSARESSEVHQHLADGRNPNELGEVEISVGQMESVQAVTEAGIGYSGEYSEIYNKAKKAAKLRLAGNVEAAQKIEREVDRLVDEAGSEEAEEAAQSGMEDGQFDESSKIRKKLTPKLMESVLREFQGSLGILRSRNYGPVLHPETFRPIDLDEVEKKLTPIFARMILEQDDEDEFDTEEDEPGLPGEDDEDPLAAELGMAPDSTDSPDDQAGMGGPGIGDDFGDFDAEGVPPGDAPGMQDPTSNGAPIDIDIGGGPSPQPIGGEQGGPGIEPGAPEPQLSPDQSRWAAAREQCPDCDDAALEKLVQVGIIGDLYNELVQRVTATSLQRGRAAEPIVASKNPKKLPTGAHNLTEGSEESISEFERRQRLSEAWDEDPVLFVDALVEGLSQDPSKISRAALMALGLDEDDYKSQDARDAKSILQGLGEQIRSVRNSLQDVRLASVGKIQALVGSRFARGAFTTEAQQMMTHLNRAEDMLNSFLESLDRYEEEFDSRYGSLIQDISDAGVGEPVGTPGVLDTPENPGDLEPAAPVADEV
jgi:hypothetical protein